LLRRSRANDSRIGTGFVGSRSSVTPYVCSTEDYTAAYRLFLQRKSLSWLYSVTMGVTPIWERGTVCCLMVLLILEK